MSITNILNNGQNVYDEVQVFDSYTLYGNRNESLPWQSWVDMVAARGQSLLVDAPRPPRLNYTELPVFENTKFIVFPEGITYQPSPWKPVVVPIVFGSCPPGYPCWDSPASGGSTVPEPSQGFLLMFSIFFVLIAAKLRPKESR